MTDSVPTPRVLNRRVVGNGQGVYVGRPSRFGNPFVIGRDGDRAAVIANYRTWLATQPDLIRAARSQLRGRDLVCWCAPKACHADVLIEIANGGSP